MEWPSFGTLAADADAPLQSDAHLTAFKLKDLLPRLVFPPPHATSSPIKRCKRRGRGRRAAKLHRMNKQGALSALIASGALAPVLIFLQIRVRALLAPTAVNRGPTSTNRPQSLRCRRTYCIFGTG